ncbi:hypothetical protein ACFQS6_12020 [Xanthomonas populi]
MQLFQADCQCAANTCSLLIVFNSSAGPLAFAEILVVPAAMTGATARTVVNIKGASKNPSNLPSLT